MKQITLTKSEKEVMDLLWNTDRPLTATEIVNLTPERTWKKSYIHLLINSLIQKNLIKSDSLVRTGRNFGRAFVAVDTREAFEIRQITSGRNFSQDSVKPLVSILLESVTDPAILDELAEVLLARKNELSEKSDDGIKIPVKGFFYKHFTFKHILKSKALLDRIPAISNSIKAR